MYGITILGTRSLKSSVGRIGSLGGVKEKSSLPASGGLQATLGFSEPHLPNGTKNSPWESASG